MQRTLFASALAATLSAEGGNASSPHIGEGTLRRRAREQIRRGEINARFDDNSVFESRGRSLYRIAHQPGETGRQLATRLRALDAHLADTPTKPKRVRTKKAAA